MSELQVCVRCGATQETHDTPEPCPHCLLALALDLPSADALKRRTSPRGESNSESVDQIGPYRPVRLLGEGGMGMVYLAEQITPVHRQVALKIIKPGMDSRAIVARFEAERQTIAVMDHPSIARIYDAGMTRDGRPYFAMEYVAGLPITEFCDRERLSIAGRLGLFADVCAAVQHAHEKQIIHRDLKPTNVLVTVVDGRPLPKVIDFGVAKALTDEPSGRTSFTEFGTLLGTPEYMSPEQFDPLVPDLDVRSDVYALGILLYELLSGALPFDRDRLYAAGYDGLRRIISEEEPPRPSTRISSSGDGVPGLAESRQTTAATLLRELRGDLDWICLKALEKDRRRRYASAADLSADIQRFLAHQPVSARSPTVTYRFGKYVRRHRAGATVCAALGAAVGLGFGTNALISSRAGSPVQAPGSVRTAAVEVLTQSGAAGNAALSPDGRLVVFEQGRGFGDRALWLTNVETRNAERLPIPAASHFYYLQWSPGGQHLYFGWENTAGVTQLVRYSFADQQVQILSDLRMRWLAVSPDERLVAGIRTDLRGGLSTLVVANLDGSNERHLAKRTLEDPYFLLSWSPDGQTIAASAGNLGLIGKPMYVAAIDVSDGRERVLTREKWLRLGAKVWLPDGSGLILLGQKWGEPQKADSWLWRVDAATGKTERISIGPDELAGWSLSLSADGETLAATRTRFDASLWMLPDGDSSRAKEIAPAWMGPKFLVDGSLMFNGVDKSLWRIGADGSSRSRISTAFYKAVARDRPAMVLALGDDADVSQIWRADLEGNHAVQITHGAAATKPDISPDGEWVVYLITVDACSGKFRCPEGRLSAWRPVSSTSRRYHRTAGG